ncbi:serine/threonine protein kinase [Rubrobacter xylanophilus DSM 9941]|uniref:non-specific serine/threonine protein kinase n=1 Tax=Rubrobacter xylanophilus (strain DSM 9941 / JCM 11954 / NBRC 16129 / PRD-1) TaxID=266117 RepID=Q1AY30_RUBXD|nr:serine/threonine-protein kinase [Rubrobacter xylanophilus]ABG03698.1 serine/threonine protein kinase [Rubrobacter xylanophilus DSM 9941]
MRLLGGRFVLERELGIGGMATVYLGRDEVLDRPVAVKILRGGFDDPETAGRFRREGRTAARLSHPNVVQVYDAGEGELEGRRVSYIVMEYVPGGDLGRMIRERGPLPGPELARIGAEVAAGLAHAHGRGVIHRDVKPPNVLLDEQGTPKLADFGIARVLDATVQATRTGVYLGTAGYSSPEQLRGERITPKSDVYSLGATLYCAAVGSPPFTGLPLEVASQHMTKEPEPPTRRGARIGRGVEEAIMACLSKDPAARPEAGELREALLAARAEGPAPAAPRPRSRPAKAEERTAVLPSRPPRGRGRRLLAALAAALLLAAGAAGGWGLLRGGLPGSWGEEGGQQRGEDRSGGRPAPPARAAAEAVFDMYVAAATNDFAASWSYLSESYRERVGSLREWESRYEDVSYVRFVEGPTVVRASGNEARVAFTVQETRPEGVRTVSGVWVCVNENGEWKLDRLLEGGSG